MPLRIAQNAAELIGNTPILRLNRAVPKGSAEVFNMGCSVKDRIALNMINAVESEDKIKPGNRFIEVINGNTGIGLALTLKIRIIPKPTPLSQGGTITGVGCYLAIQSIRAGIVPKTLDTGIYEEIIRITNDKALSFTRESATKEGVLAGYSTTAAAGAPDTGECYLSMYRFD
jgi:cysteine synthase